MTPDQARQRADRIIAALTAGDDPETEHYDQDQFLVDVLRSVEQHGPGGCYGCSMLAREALRVADAPGTRWYA